MANKKIISIKDIDSTDRKQKNTDFPEDNRTVERYLKDRLDNSKGEVNIKIPKPVYDRLKGDKDKWKSIQEYLINRNTQEIIDKAIIEVEKLLEKEPKFSTPYNLVDEIPIIAYNARYHERENIYMTGKDFNEDITRLDEIYYNIHHEVIKNVYRKLESETIKELREALDEDDKKINKLEETLENWKKYHEKKLEEVKRYYKEEFEREKKRLQN